jgi:glycosyltransferase involved in cell wall biosynthesis
MSVSVVILTLNEEETLPACLASVKWCDDIVVFDSFSIDRTVEIARGAGARVVQRRFDDYGRQREAARTQVVYKHPWVLALDADELPEQELIDEVVRITEGPLSPYAAYRVRRKDFFMGRWIKHATLYPSWFIRLYRPDRIRYGSRSVHEYPAVDGTIGALQGHLIHHSFGKGFTAWFHKHVRYAELEAREALVSACESRLDWPGLLSLADPVRRRRALKTLSQRLPCRASLRFLYMYLIRLGLLDGAAGFTYCRLLAMYEYLIVLQMEELRRRERGHSL